MSTADVAWQLHFSVEQVTYVVYATPKGRLEGSREMHEQSLQYTSQHMDWSRASNGIINLKTRSRFAKHSPI